MVSREVLLRQVLPSIADQRLAGPELVRLAVGRDSLDASPVRGMRLGGVDEKMCVPVAVARQ